MGSKHASHKIAANLTSDILKKVRTSLLDEFDKTPKQLERHIKGVSNHRRIEILILIARNEWISLDQIATSLNCNIKTLAEHTARLAHAGLIYKKYIGRNVGHILSPYGKIFYKFLRTF